MPEWNDVLSIGPGPASYLPASTNTGPRLTIQRRYNSSTVETTPGPGDYTPIWRSTSPSFSIQKRTTRPKSPPTPGPADYHGDSLALRPRSPTFRFNTQPRRAQSAFAHERTRSPGPADYKLPDLNVTRRSSRASSLSGRPQSRPMPISPGPATYNVNISASWSRVHGGTIGIRHSPTFSPTHALESLGPGPAGYYPKQIRRTAPAFSMPHSSRKSTTVCMGMQTPSPGPADYNVSNLLLTKRRAPSFTFSGRHYIYRNEIT